LVAHQKNPTVKAKLRVTQKTKGGTDGKIKGA